MNKLKVMTVVGTRPEIIRLSRVMTRLDGVCQHVIVHTGQNYDYELNEVFFQDLKLRKPDHFLGVGGGTLGETLGRILSESERVMALEPPDAMLVLGDTNSALAALMARRLKIPIYHMEAGNRSFDRNVPEETNRKIVDHIADFNLVYTEHARRHLLAEGLPHRRIYLTGSPMREVLDHYRSRIAASPVLESLALEPQSYFLASLHREENVDSPARLAGLVNALRGLSERHGKPVILSTHPRTRKRLEALGHGEDTDMLRFHKPFGFLDYCKLQCEAYCTLSDSGTIAEESAILGFAAVTPRDSIERPEALDTGAILMSGVEPDNIISTVEVAVKLGAESRATGRGWPIPDDYQIIDTSARVVSLIMGTARLSNDWDGIRGNHPQ